MGATIITVMEESNRATDTIVEEPHTLPNGDDWPTGATLIAVLDERGGLTQPSPELTPVFSIPKDVDEKTTETE